MKKKVELLNIRYREKDPEKLKNIDWLQIADYANSNKNIEKGWKELFELK